MKKKIIDMGQLVRVALYIRVSGEEQKIKGLSLEAQQERLEAYAKERGWVIVGIFIDAAKTARKNMHKRTEFQRMMELVKRDEVDMLLFCRLDRWFRSVADYYKIMEILEAHGCGWKTTDEEYDTTTANGRLYINVKLSIAQNEADIDGERIDVVFDSKVAHGTVVSGSCPFGFRVNEEKRLEIVPEDAAIVQDAFDHYESTITQRGTVKYIRETYGVNWCDATFRRMLHEELYTGVYNRGGRYNPNFCPVIISREQFDRVQKLTERNARSSPSGRVYIFTSILTCAECGHKLVGYLSRGLYYYRCSQHFQRGRCNHNHSSREDLVEEWLFSHLGEELERCKLEWEVRAAERRRSTSGKDKAVLKRKLTKLKELYVNDLIDIEEYRKDFQIYSAALQQLPEPVAEQPPDFSAVEKLLQNDFKTIYDTLTREEKRTLWRSAIKEIRVDSENNITGISFG
ncbi:recombinase family protein [Mediterraneibacter gnavus]|uniref:recombinase family protein n=1 Tax=Mediterraneibacter gnavus TaxID=33038 RepID=UPI0035668DEA